MQGQRAHPFFKLDQARETAPRLASFLENFFPISCKAKLARVGARVKKLSLFSAKDDAQTINIDPSHKLYFVIIAAQIIWFGLGLSLFYDTAESILHWPHLLVVTLSSGLMIITAWFGMRAMLLLSAVSLPGILSVLYFSLSQAMPGEGAFALWTQMVSGKSMEYISGMFIVMGSCVGSVTAASHTAQNKFSRTTLFAVIGFVIGNGLVFLSGINTALAAGETNMSIILSQQGPTLLGLCLLGLSARSAKNNSGLSGCGKVVAKFTKIPVRLIILLIGTFSAVFSDWYSQYMYGWLQYVSLLVPPIALLLMGKFFFNQKSNQLTI